jgi:hypothetical protein
MIKQDPSKYYYIRNNKVNCRGVGGVMAGSSASDRKIAGSLTFDHVLFDASQVAITTNNFDCRW